MQCANNKVGWGAVGQGKPNKCQQALQSPTMQALFVFLVNTCPFNVTVYSLRKTKKGKWRGRWVSFCRWHLSTTRLKVHRHWKALQAGSYWVCLLPEADRKDSHGLSGALEASLHFCFPLFHSEKTKYTAIYLCEGHRTHNPVNFAWWDSKKA